MARSALAISHSASVACELHEAQFYLVLGVRASPCAQPNLLSSWHVCVSSKLQGCTHVPGLHACEVFSFSYCAEVSVSGQILGYFYSPCTCFYLFFFHLEIFQANTVCH